MARSGKPLGVLVQHLFQRSDAGDQTKALERAVHILPSRLEDGRVYVAMLATTVDDEEPQLLTQEIACDTVATIEDALAVIRQAIEKV